MTDHIIVYRGLVGCSLGVMQGTYLPDILRIVNTPDVNAGLLINAPMDFYEEHGWLENLHKSKRTNQIFAILRHSSDTGPAAYVGHMGIHRIQWPQATAVTGSVLDSTAWGKGLGTEAKLLLQYHAFRVLGLRKLTSSVKAFNARSLGHLIKTGYRIVGRFKKQEFHDGEYVDEILLECFREDWESVWEMYQTSRKLPKLTSKQKKIVSSETQNKNDRS